LKAITIILGWLIFINIAFVSCDKTQETPIPAFVAKAVEYDYSDSLLFERIDNYFENRYRVNGFNGVVLYAKNGKIVYNKAFGFSNFETKDSLQLDDAFQLASVSKTITAVAVLQLVQDSLIGLEQTVQDFFPKFPYENVTIRQLLSHRSGLANYMYFADEYWENKDSSISNKVVLEMMETNTPKPYHLPDVRYQYCNTNFAILASIIEKVTKEKYENYLKKHIFQPLDMENAFVYNRNTQPDLPKNVIGYNGIYRQKENSYQNGVVGDKGIYASAMDLFKLDRALYENDFLDSTLLAEAFTPQNPDLTRRNRDNYGLGWRIQVPSDFGAVVYHSGWWKGFKTYYIRMIEKDQTIIVLTNVTRGGYLNRAEMQGLF
jgi:CubicO group peptidase (beta-lactamase class C family)